MSLIKLVPVFFSIPKEKNGNKKRNIAKPRTIYATVIGLIDNARHPHTHMNQFSTKNAPNFRVKLIY